jgi:hypothetical protein
MDYKNKLNQDLKFGLLSEEAAHETLEGVFGKLNKSKDNPNMGDFYEFDKYNDNYFLEMKTRKINHNQYDTLFFGENKFIEAKRLLKENPNLRIFYLWKCYDGIYGWEHGSSEFRVCKRGRWDRGKREIDDCVDVKLKYIKRVEELLN